MNKCKPNLGSIRLNIRSLAALLDVLIRLSVT